MSETILTENALKILEKRYFLRDKEGNVIEDWDKLCRRVAKFVASAEKTAELRKEWEERFYQEIYNLRFIPSSPILFNAGTKTPQLNACITGDTYIYTIHGLEEMKNLKEGDYVLTHKGRFKKIRKIISKGIKNIIKLGRGGGHRKRYSLKCTPDHLINTATNEWKRADSLNVKAKQRTHTFEDTKLPFIDKSVSTPISNFVLSEIFPEINEKQTKVHEGYIRFLNKHEERSGKYNDWINPVLNNIKNDNELAWFFGLYLSEGDIDKNNLRFTLHEKEENIAKRLKRTVKDHFGLHGKIVHSKHGKWINYITCSKILCELLKKHFSHGFKDKSIPLWAFSMPKEWQSNLLDGILTGDGCKVNDSSNSLSLANPTLVYQTLLIARSCGLHSNFTPDTRVKLSKHMTSTTLIGESKRIENTVGDLRISEKQEVFDIEVEDDHTFVAGDFIVHNCFLVDIPDSMEGIFKAIKDSATIYKMGGGCGFNLGNIRPKNSSVSGTGGTASGPISFMEVFDKTVDVVKQGAKRRGAALGCLPIHHPDIEEFIKCKNDKKSFNNFNISIGITDEFIGAVERDKTIKLRHPEVGEVQEVRARKLWDKIVKSAHATGDPGLIFIDTMNKYNPIPDKPIVGTNPCSELPMSNYESCVLGQLNLTKFVKDEEHDVDYLGLQETVEIGVRFLDNTIDLNAYPILEIEKSSKESRKIGLGVTGYADMLIILGMRYNSNESVKFADQLMGFVNKKAFKYSVMLGAEKGNFPDFDRSIFKSKSKHHKKPRTLRNATRTTVAPCGTTSVIAGVSSGIEPNFAFEYERTSTDNVKLDWIHPLYKKTLDAKDGTLTKKQEKIFVSAKEIDADWHLKTQQSFQLHCDNAISKTINIPFKTPIKEIRRIYRKAYDLSLKGITVFRDGCKGKQVLYDKKARCPQCKKYTVEYTEGCRTCRSCGWSACDVK